MNERPNADSTRFTTGADGTMIALDVCAIKVAPAEKSQTRAATLTVGDIELHRSRLPAVPSDEDRRALVDAILTSAPAMSDDRDLITAMVEAAIRWGDPPADHPFPVELLPESVGQYVVAGADARATDAGGVALPMLCTLAACVGTTHRVAPKPDWQAPAILWGAVVARSGSVKSPGVDLARELLDEREAADKAEFDAAKDRHRIERSLHDRAMGRWKRSKGDDEPPEPPTEPIARRLMIADATLEALCPVLAENPRGLFVVADELRAWLDGLGYYSAGGSSGRDEAHWLTLFDGRPLSVDRKTNRERIFIQRTGVSVAGTIQPGTLARCIDPARVDSGLLARLLLVAPKSRPKRWTDATMPEGTAAAMRRIVRRLLSLDFGDDGRPTVLPLAPEAKQRFAAFVNSHGAETFAHGDAMAATWSKLEGYALRFALVDHLTRWASSGDDTPAGRIETVSVDAGIELARWFADEAERVFRVLGFGEEPDLMSDPVAVRDSIRLIEWLKGRGGRASERDIRRGPCRYRGNDGGRRLDDDAARLVADGVAWWDSQPKTRYLTLTGNGESDAATGSPDASVVAFEGPSPGDTGDSDSCGETHRESVEVSPRGRASVAGVGDSCRDTSATLRDHHGDTSPENAGKRDQPSLSPVSPPSPSAKRIRGSV